MSDTLCPSDRRRGPRRGAPAGATGRSWSVVSRRGGTGECTRRQPRPAPTVQVRPSADSAMIRSSRRSCGIGRCTALARRIADLIEQHLDHVPSAQIGLGGGSFQRVTRSASACSRSQSRTARRASHGCSAGLMIRPQPRSGPEMSTVCGSPGAASSRRSPARRPVAVAGAGVEQPDLQLHADQLGPAVLVPVDVQRAAPLDLEAEHRHAVVTSSQSSTSCAPAAESTASLAERDRLSRL